jgi:hypothetical protein
MVDTKTFKITVQRSVAPEEYVVELNAESAMEAFDDVQRMVKERNKSSESGTYHIVKVESEEK